MKPIEVRLEDLPLPVVIVDGRGGRVDYPLVPAGRKKLGASLQKQPASPERRKLS